MEAGKEGHQEQPEIPEGFAEAWADVVMDLHEKIPPDSSGGEPRVRETKGDEPCPDTSPATLT